MEDVSDGSHRTLDSKQWNFPVAGNHQEPRPTQGFGPKRYRQSLQETEGRMRWPLDLIQQVAFWLGPQESAPDWGQLT